MTLKKPKQNAQTCSPAHPWVRLAAVFGILLLLLCSGVQATHLHRGWTAHATQSGPELLSSGVTPDTEANCPLCLTGGTALLAGLPCAPPVQMRVMGLVARCGGRLVPTDVHFAQSTRPPPFPA